MKSFLKVLSLATLATILFNQPAGHAQSLNNTYFQVTVVAFNGLGEYDKEFSDVFVFRDNYFGTAIMDKNPKWIQQRTFSEKEVCLPPGCVTGKSPNYAWTADLIRTECEPDCIWRFTGNRIGPVIVGTITSSLGDHFVFFGLIVDPASPSQTLEAAGDVVNYGIQR